MSKMWKANRGEGADTTDSRGMNMKREKLRRVLAWAILEELGPNHARTIPNVERYVLPKRSKYRITKDEYITLADIMMALMILTYVCTQKPIAWQYGTGDGFRKARQNEFMNIVLPVA